MRAFLAYAVFLVGVSMGGEEEHLALAKEFDRLSGAQDKGVAATIVADVLFAGFPELEHRKEGFVKEIEEIYESEEYSDKKARMYMEIFTEEELKQVIEVVKLPGFKLMNSKRAEMARGMMEVGDSLKLKEKIEELLLEEGDDPAMKELEKKLDFKVVRPGILAVLEKISATKGHEELGGLIRDPKRVVPLIQEYYKEGENEWVAPKIRDWEIFGFDRGIYGCEVELDDFSVKSMAFESVGDRYLLDWESWVGHSELPWKKFKKEKPTEPFLVRGVLRADLYYNFGYQDEEKWDSYALESPDGEQVIYGYVEKGSAFAKELKEVVWSMENREMAATLRVKYGEGVQQGSQVLIAELVTGGWVTKGDEGLE